MSGVVKELCALSIFCGVALTLAPEGSVKRVMHVLCSVVLLAAVLAGVKGLDYDEYARELCRYQEREEALLTQGQELQDRLNRLVIQQETEAYIMDKAEQLGLELRELTLTLRWDTEGFWVPESAAIRYSGEESRRERLAQLMEAELGIPRDRQEWSRDESMEG